MLKRLVGGVRGGCALACVWAVLVGAALPVQAEPVRATELEPEVGYTYEAFPFDGGGAIQHVAISPDDPDLVLAAVDVAGVYRSTDGGVTWSAAWEGLGWMDFDYAVADVYFDPVEPGVVWAATGKTWGSSLDSARSVSRLYRSDDAGQSWQRVSTDLAFCGQYHTTVRQYGDILWRDPEVEGRLLAGTTIMGVRQSLDGGETWETVLPGEEVGVVSTVRADPTREGVIYVSSQRTAIADEPAGIWRSQDNGQSFEPVMSELSIRSISVADSGAVLAAGEDGLWISVDGGESWQPHESGIDGDAVEDYRFFTADADPHAPERFIAAGYTSPNPFRHPKVFVLEGVESSWQPLYENVREAYRPYGRPGVDGWHGFLDWFAPCPSTVVFHPEIEGRVYLSDWYTVNRSDDGGRTWRANNRGLQTVVPINAVWDRADPDAVYLGLIDVGAHRGGIHGGDLWVRSIRNHVPAVHAHYFQFEADGAAITLTQFHGHGDGPARVFRRVDALEGGMDADWRPEWGEPTEGRGGWREVYNEPTSMHRRVRVQFGFDGQTLLILAANGRLIRSDDLGASWSHYEDSVTGQIEGTAYDYVSAEDGLWIIQTRDGRTWLARTPGEWEEVEGWPRRPKADPTTSGRWFGIDEDNGVMVSEDEGQSWRKVLTHAQELTVSDDGLVYAYDVRRDNYGNPWIARSEDGGQTWQRLSTPPGYRQSGGLWPDPRDGRRFIWGAHGIGMYLAEPTD